MYNDAGLTSSISLLRDVASMVTLLYFVFRFVTVVVVVVVAVVVIKVHHYTCLYVGGHVRCDLGSSNY